MVRIETDEDLQTFVLRVLEHRATTRRRRDLIGGRLQVHGSRRPAAAGTRRRAGSTKGAVTERAVAGRRQGRRPARARAASGAHPAGRDSARALGVPIEKER